MSRIAKVFMAGRCQAVRLPAEFRCDSKEVCVRRDPAAGGVVSSRGPADWDDFFGLVETLDLPTDFKNDGNDALPQVREPF